MKMSPRLIVIGGLAVVLTVVAFVVFLPVVVFRPEPTLETQPYTALEQQGRDLFVSNGCMYCHSQFTRPGDVTPSRASEAGQYAYDQPHQLGTIRTGPDLANIGLKRGDRWEIDHLKSPRSFTPNSVMPNFNFLSDAQLAAIVAYLNTLGNHQNASTDLMVPVKYLGPEYAANTFPLTVDNFNKGRDIFATKCLTCHGCAGKGDGPYSMINNARPANLRDDKYKNRPVNYLFWRVSEGVPGTVMPTWQQSLSDDERWLVILFAQKAFIDMVPDYPSEGDLPAAFAGKTLAEPTLDNIDAGKAIFVANCAFCHGYGGNGDGPDAPGLLPQPPSFANTSTYAAWVPGDYYWRASESLPMRAMPQWHTWFTPEQIQLVAGYVKNMLVFPNPDNQPVDPVIPAQAEAQYTMPADTDLMRGRQVYLQRCWICHGAAGQGEGPDAAHLSPKPADFTKPALKGLPDSEWYWKVSRGIGNAAMPQWHLLLSPEDRWAAIRYVKDTFVNPSEPTAVSDVVPPAYASLNPAPNAPENDQALDPSPNAPTPDTIAWGKQIYELRCIGCHGPEALGNGPYGALLRPTPANLAADPAVSAGLDFWYWRVDAGVVGDDDTHPTAMPAWRNMLSEDAKWAVIFYARQLAHAKGGPGGGN